MNFVQDGNLQEIRKNYIDITSWYDMRMTKLKEESDELERLAKERKSTLVWIKSHISELPLDIQELFRKAWSKNDQCDMQNRSGNWSAAQSRASEIQARRSRAHPQRDPGEQRQCEQKDARRVQQTHPSDREALQRISGKSLESLKIQRTDVINQMQILVADKLKISEFCDLHKN